MGKTLPDHIDGLCKYISAPSEKANEDLIIKYFRKVFGDEFKRQKEAKNSDGYVQGQFVLELKTTNNDWLAGLYQGIAYQRVLDFPLVVVATKNFFAIWRVEDIEENIREEILTSNSAPNAIGKKMAQKYKSKKNATLKKAIWRFRDELLEGLFTQDPKSLIQEINQFESTLKSQKKVRKKITSKNFTNVIKEMLPFFDKNKPTKAVRAFYSMLFSWENNSHLEISKKISSQATLGGEKIDFLVPGKRIKFKEFVESHYICLDKGQDRDEFFSLYDKALDAADKNFRIRHGIYFTDLDLSKLMMWFVKQKLGQIGKNHLIIDPACGSGNLVTNWKSPLEMRHKVVSEIEPELLYTVEKRMEGDAWHNGKYTVVPKVEENKGLNFLDKSAEEYLDILTEYLESKGQSADKPLAILCNPPYRNDDDQKSEKVKYTVHPSIIELTGKDAGTDRTNCFLAQMKLLAETAKESGLPGNTLLLLFTGIQWLTKRKTHLPLRKQILGSFEDIDGVLVNSKEFFDVSGSFPIAFTIWKYKGSGLNEDREIPLRDLTWLKKKDLSNIEWGQKEKVDETCAQIFEDKKCVKTSLGLDYESIRVWSGKTMVDFKRGRRKAEKNLKVTGGLPKGDRRQTNKKAYGESDGEYLGFMDDLTPVRVKKGSNGYPWFRLNPQFMEFQKTRCYSGPADKFAYSAQDLTDAKKLFFWYSLARTFKHIRYPLWANNLEMWGVDEKLLNDQRMINFIFSISYAENECIETYFPANNPIRGCEELHLTNPMTPLIKDSFWKKTMEPAIKKTDQNVHDLLENTNKLFKEWKKELGSDTLKYVDFEAPYFLDEKRLGIGSGLRQIRDYSLDVGHEKLNALFENVNESLKKVKEDYYTFLESEVNYFELRETRKSVQIPQSKFEKIVDARLALASKIVNDLSDDKSMGRVKFSKVFYLADQITKVNLDTKYFREPAGPLDQRALYNEKIGIESQAAKRKLFVSEKMGRSKTAKVKYNPDVNIEIGLKSFDAIYKSDAKKVNQLIELVRPMDTDQTEIAATIYACWNDLLLSKKAPSDDLIIKEFREKWHEKKKRFSKARIQKAIDWMKKNNLIPMGKGQKTQIKIKETAELF